ncbi:MAG: GTPase HflX [Firmicutes bacterium]|nr:GTPase HflX [Bacillota bacterium]
MHKTEKQKEKVILVYINLNSKEDTDEVLEELSGLAEACNMEVVGTLSQNLKMPDIRTFIGSGKLLDLKEMAESMEADSVVFDNELVGSQIRNLEDELGVRVATKSMLILDIFARRATTNEGKKQTELAQLKYMRTRLVGSYEHMGGQGGVGMRGPGETKLELDRRNMKDKIAKLEKECDEIEAARLTANKTRKQTNTKSVVLVGYTNVGKSTIMNKLTKADVLEKDMLFATLDTTTRKLFLTYELSVTLSDTVGFIKNLPHEFVKAFKSTLNAAVEADVLLLVLDASNRHILTEYEVTRQVLGEIGAQGKQIVVINKTDERLEDSEAIEQIKKESSGRVIEISAKTGAGLEELKALITNFLNKASKI